MIRIIALILYYGIFRHLPHSTIPIFGFLSERLRYFSCKCIFARCGKNVNIEKGVRFGNGRFIEIGNSSGIGLNSKVPNNLIIGDYVMIGPGVTILTANHSFERTDIPIMFQKYKKSPKVIIEGDVWIGLNAIIMPGLKIKRGSIIGAGSVLTKNFPEYSIIGGNPSKLIRSRINDVPNHIINE